MEAEFDWGLEAHELLDFPEALDIHGMHRVLGDAARRDVRVGCSICRHGVARECSLGHNNCGPYILYFPLGPPSLQNTVKTGTNWPLTSIPPFFSITMTGWRVQHEHYASTTGTPGSPRAAQEGQT